MNEPSSSASALRVEVHKHWPATMRILLPGHGDRQAMMQAINQVAVYRFISKPGEDLEPATAWRGAIDLFLLRDENQRLLMQVRQPQSALDRQQQELLRLEVADRLGRDSDGSELDDAQPN